MLEELEISDEALEQAIVGAIGDLDSPMTSQQKGFRGLTHYLTGVTTETRQQFRDEVLGTTRASFAALAEVRTRTLTPQPEASLSLSLTPTLTLTLTLTLTQT